MSKRSRWSETGAVASGGGALAVSHAAETNRTHVASSIDISGDAASLIQINSPVGTVLWTVRYSAAFADGFDFADGYLTGAVGQLLRVRIASSTSTCEANMSGYTV